MKSLRKYLYQELENVKLVNQGLNSFALCQFLILWIMKMEILKISKKELNFSGAIILVAT